MKLWARICVSSSRQSVYNSAVKQARKEKYGKHSLGFMPLGNQDEKKNNAFFLKIWFYGFLLFKLYDLVLSFKILKELI